MATTNQRKRTDSQKARQSASGETAAAPPSGKLSHMRDEVSGYMPRGTEQFGHMTRGHEGSAVLVALAAGFGIGFVIGCPLMSANSRPESWRERYMSEGFGRKLMDRVERLLPEMISEHLNRK